MKKKLDKEKLAKRLLRGIALVAGTELNYAAISSPALPLEDKAALLGISVPSLIYLNLLLSEKSSHKKSKKKLMKVF